MKNIFTSIFLMVSFLSFSQNKIKAFIQKENNLTFEQYDLIKKVNEFNSDILVSKVAIKNYWNDFNKEELIESYLKYSIIPSDCSSYSVLLYPDNTRLDYEYILKTGVIHYGNITVFGGKVFRVDYEINGKVLKHFYKVNNEIIYTH